MFIVGNQFPMEKPNYFDAQTKTPKFVPSPLIVKHLSDK